jgi:peptide chain release factor subunit 1
MAITTQISSQLDRLAHFDSGPFPVVSLYLNLQPDEHGRDRYDTFLRKELPERIRTYATGGPERESLKQDAEKINRYLAEVDRSANGLALFSSSGSDLFEPVVLAAPILEHRLYIADQPHLYPLARVIDEYPPYAVLLADTASARIFVVAAGAIALKEAVEGTKTRRHKMGGWSQARYQRHLENYHLHHAKEIADTLARIVRDEQIQSVIVSGDEVIVPLLKEQFPKELAERIVDSVKLATQAPEHEIVERTREAMREQDEQSDRERVDALLDAYRAGGLATVGAERTRNALEMGQVDELLIAATTHAIDPGPLAKSQRSGSQRKGERTPEERAADELIVKARLTSARIRFIEDAALLAPFGGVGAFLRFKL